MWEGRRGISDLPGEPTNYDLSMKNRSVPVDAVLPHIGYQDVAEASEWLGRVFGFQEAFRYGKPVAGVQMYLGQAYIMLRNAREGCMIPAHLGYGTQNL